MSDKPDDSGSDRYSLTGAVILHPDAMLPAQSDILERILLHVYEIAKIQISVEAKSKSREKYLERQAMQRPHQVFLIDGARGAGKTVLLLTVRHYLQYLGNPEFGKTSSLDSDPYAEKIGQFSGDIDKKLDKEKSNIGKFNFRKKHGHDTAERQTAISLPILFPSDLESGQSIMEGLLALMTRTIEEKINDIGKSVCCDKDQVKKFKDLKKKVNTEVVKGWFLSRNAGIDAMLRDSADYTDFLTKRGEANVASFGRVGIWRDFVNDYLDLFKAELLAVFFDDTDLSPETNRDILHTLRIFLDHPRIVTVIAGNLRAMRQSAVLEGMRELSTPIEALKSSATVTGGEWRGFVRQQIEASFEKILPRQFRYFIRSDQHNRAPQNDNRSTEAKDSPPASGINGNFRKMMSRQGFADFCGDMLRDRRPSFLEAKHKAHFRLLSDHREFATNGPEETALESFLSWWMLRNRYFDVLRPRTARQMVALNAFFGTRDSNSSSEFGHSEGKKRLSVVLFESSDNHVLINRLGDEDREIINWLRRQQLKSNWRDERYIEINEKRIYENTYSYQYLFYLIDLKRSMPALEHGIVEIPKGLLPRPAGINLTGHPAFFPLMKRQKKHGVSYELNHTLIPANCLYNHDVSALPDLSWKTSSDDNIPDHFTSNVFYQWSNYFFFDRHEMSVTKNDQDSAEDKEVKDYFLSVVVPLSSLDITRYMSTDWKNSPTDRMNLEDCVDKSLLKEELSAGVFHNNHLRRLEHIRRRYEYLQTCGIESAESRSAVKFAAEELEKWKKEIIEIVLPDDYPEDLGLTPKSSMKLKYLQNHLISYEWLMNDVRRSWHAARIFLYQLSEIFKVNPVESDVEVPEINSQFNFSRNDLYTIPRRESFDKWLYHSIHVTTLLGLNEKIRHSIVDKALGLETSENPKTWRDNAIAEGFHLVSQNENEFGIKKEDGLFSIIEDWLPKQLERDIKNIIKQGRGAEVGEVQFPLLPNDLLLLIKTEIPQGGDYNERPLMFNPHYAEFTDTARNNQTNGQDSDERKNSLRPWIARVLLLFFYGLAPTLPALIHIEVASIMKIKDYDRALTVLMLWEERIWQRLWFVQKYRRALEVTKIRLDLMEISKSFIKSENRKNSTTKFSSKYEIFDKPTPSGFGVTAGLMPDMSYTTLGIKGIRSFNHQNEINNLLSKNNEGDPWEAFRAHLVDLENKWDEVDSKQGRVQWRPIVEDTVENLIQVLNFILTTREIVKRERDRQKRN